MRLLLDTHILLWSELEPERLTPRVAADLEDAENELWVSPITTWEVCILADKGRIVLEPDPVRWLRKVLRESPLREAALTHEVALESHLLDLPHKDPADRFLGATAKVYDLTLVTTDERLLRSRSFATLPNR